MSLILEALKKREREKQVPERGFLVTASAGWPDRRRSWLLAAAGAGLVVAVGGILMWGRGSTAPRPSEAAAPAGPRTPPTPEPRVAQTPMETFPTAPAVVPRDVPMTLPGARPPAATARSAPTTPRPADPATPSAETDDYVLHAITRRDGQPIALLNDRLVREGDVFGDVKVVRIGETEIEIEVRGTRRLLRF